MGLLDGKIVLVSGVGPGLGRQTAAAALREGAAVALGDLHGDQLEHIRDELDPGGARTLARRTDVTSGAMCEALVAATRERFGRLDAVVHVAADDRAVGGLMDGNVDDWDRLVDVNIKGTLRMTKAAVPLLREGGGGSVVIIGSIGAVQPLSEHPMMVYGGTKGALLTIGRYLARELGPDGIRVNTVAPGWKWGPVLEAGLYAQAEHLGIDVETLLAPIRARVALRRLAGDADVADAIVFFCSDLARNITGQTLHVDAGDVLT
jgi:NAD(P)-dependent dehydrogenase (short-subunit alcohol dehydrogenase family)